MLINGEQTASLFSEFEGLPSNRKDLRSFRRPNRMEVPAAGPTKSPLIAKISAVDCHHLNIPYFACAIRACGMYITGLIRKG